MRLVRKPPGGGWRERALEQTATPRKPARARARQPNRAGFSPEPLRPPRETRSLHARCGYFGKLPGSGLGSVLRADGGEGASLAGAGKSRARYAQRDGRLLEERLPVIVCLTWAKRAGNTYRVSFGCRNADAIAMNTPRRLCGTMPPTHVPHPPTSFLCSCCTETGPFRAISDRSRGAGVESPLAYLRRRRVLCTLPILQPCALRHALHC